MIKKIFFLFLLILLVQFISAVGVDMKNNYSAGETLIAKISGSFQTPILIGNIQFYRGHVKIPLDYDVGKINDNYYVYAMLPQEPDNSTYSMIITNVKYQKGNQISEDEIKKEFTISSQKANFSVNPGFIVTKDDFFLTVQNLEDYKINLNIKTKEEVKESKGFFASLFGSSEENETTLQVNSGDLKKIEFRLQDFNESTFQTVELSTTSLKYEVPVYIFVNHTESSSVEKTKEFRFDPLNTNISLLVNSNKNKTLYLYNTGQDEIRDIILTVPDGLKPYISLSKYQIDRLGADYSTEIEMYIESGNEKQTIEGKISATTSDEIIYLPVILNFFKKTEEVPKDIDNYISIKKCSELKGIICKEDEECSGKQETASDGKCCTGECKQIAKSYTNKVIGILIIILVILIIYWFFIKRYIGAKRKVDIVKIGEKR